MSGMFRFDDVRGSLMVEELGDLVIAKELASEVTASVGPDDSLRRAFEVFEKSGLHEIPVLDPDEPGRLIGMLTRRDAMDAYHRELSALPAGH